MGTLTDKYCIVGVGETPHMRPSNRTTLSMACEAVKKAMADAGLEPRDIDGMTSYPSASTTHSTSSAEDQAPRPWSDTPSACWKLGTARPSSSSAR